MHIGINTDHMYSYRLLCNIAAFHAYYIIQGKLRHAFSMLSASSKQTKDLCAGIQQNPGYKKGSFFKPPLSCLPKAINRQPIFRSVALLITY